MIIRIYRVTPKAERLKDYEKLLLEKILPFAHQAKGCVKAQVLKSLGVVREVVLITQWDSLESVKAFAGSDWSHPVLVENEAEMLEGPPEVKHYHLLGGF